MEFDTPSPQKRSGHDFSKNPLLEATDVHYKAGKLDEASVRMLFDGKLEPSYMTNGFLFYDKTTKAKVALNKFTVWTIGIYYGSFSSGEGKGDIRYLSNIVPDTRNAIIQSSYFVDGQRKTFAIGNYSDVIAPAFKAIQRKSSYEKILVGHVPEVGGICRFFLSATAEAAFVKAVATARQAEEWKTSLFGLGELESECWVFQFDGQFEAVVFSDKDAKRVPATVPASPKSKSLVFQPIITGGVIRADNPKYGNNVAGIQQKYAELSEYIASEQEYLRELLNAPTAESPQVAPAPIPQYPNMPVNTNIRPNHDNSGFEPAFAGDPVTRIEPAASEFDDMPF